MSRGASPRAAQTAISTAARLARQGSAGLERPRRSGRLHPGEGPSKVLIDDLLHRTRGTRPSSTSTTRTGRPDDPRRPLQVMGQPGEREGLARQGPVHLHRSTLRIKFNSNFQWSTTSPRREGTQRSAHHARAEQVKAFRDTWRDGFIRTDVSEDRLTVARDLLTESDQSSCRIRR